MKKKTILISIAAVAFVLLSTLGLLIYGAYQGAAYLISQATPQIQMQNLPDQLSTHWDQLQKTLQTTECQSAIAQVTNLQVWLTGADEMLIPQIGMACLGNYFKNKEKTPHQTEPIDYELI